MIDSFDMIRMRRSAKSSNMNHFPGLLSSGFDGRNTCANENFHKYKSILYGFPVKRPHNESTEYTIVECSEWVHYRNQKPQQNNVPKGKNELIRLIESATQPI